MPDFTQRYNLPDKNDPNFGDKLVDLIRTLFENQDSDVKTFKAIQTPQGTRQNGDIWFDSSDEKLKVNTSSGVKIVQYE